MTFVKPEPSGDPWYTVHGVVPAGVVPAAVRHGAVLVIVNGGPTEMDALADVVVSGSISDALPALVGGLPPAG